MNVKQKTTDELIEQLYKIEGQAEIIDNEIIQMPLHGGLIGRACGAILSSIHDCSQDLSGSVYTSTTGFLVDLPHRKSFCADASYYTGPGSGMEFLPQAPDFAVEIRDECDYTPDAKGRLSAKRADYFAAGTQVVWDVDLLGDDVVRVYRADKPTEPTIYRKGDQAEAEPAVPGWTMPVDELFE